jgi:hypothetical protein
LGKNSWFLVWGEKLNSNSSIPSPMSGLRAEARPGKGRHRLAMLYIFVPQIFLPVAQRSTPYALRPTPYALRPSPFALRPTPYALRPTPYALRRFAVDANNN